jgi:hypothetical protein
MLHEQPIYFFSISSLTEHLVSSADHEATQNEVFPNTLPEDGSMPKHVAFIMKQYNNICYTNLLLLDGKLHKENTSYFLGKLVTQLCNFQNTKKSDYDNEGMWI